MLELPFTPWQPKHMAALAGISSAAQAAPFISRKETIKAKIFFIHLHPSSRKKA
jgi:hypothetical protein